MNSAQFIARWEGLADVRDGLVYPYIDIAGVPTVGYGFTDPAVVNAAPHPIPRMDRLLEFETMRRESAAISLSPILGDPVNARRLVAITSFIFNLGAGNYRASTLRRRVNEGNWYRAGDEILRWKFAGGKPIRGLLMRRKAERELLL